MRVEEVTSEEDEMAFLQMPLIIYKQDPNYIRPLDADLKEIFDPKQNKLFSNGKCCRWLLMDGRSSIGRIAAFYHHDIAMSYEQPTGGIGFFECIDSERAAELLFDTAREWLRSLGMEAMDGPVNFGSRERWWGLLVDGWHPPCYGANYNPPYYRHLFEHYGFSVYFKQFTFLRRLDVPLDSKLEILASRLKRNNKYIFRHVDKGELDKLPAYFSEVYNKAWVDHVGVYALNEEDVRAMLLAMKPILDVKALWFAFYEGVPIAFFIAIPDANELLLKHCNGKLNFKALCCFFIKKKFRLGRNLLGMVFGVVPEHRNKGVDLGLIASAGETLLELGYRQLQMNWIGDFNPRMVRMCRKIGAEIYKMHHTYRYLFDRNKELQKHKKI
ncbi:hypothetical protein [Olivibacter sitiensis]|uniref:hypothetical protein n=1 Tax=Olivibacter sitiensis TaxID=376470 RepID=UPI000422EDC8|nr:hypothetical protein [Olivibacter sitiensis]